MFRKIGVIVNPTKPKSTDVVKRILSSVSRYKDTQLFLDIEAKNLVNKDNLPFFKKNEIIDLSDMVIVVGGDGTFLNVGRLMTKKDIPIMGINSGTLGFLAEFDVNETESSIDKLMNGKLTIEKRPTISVNIQNKVYRCINDIAIKRQILARIIEVEMFANQKYITTFRGDGVIVSTATGSTAYSLSAGGPIVFPTLNTLIITPICPHKLTLRPLVVSGDTVLDVSVKTDTQSAIATFDGQEAVEVEKGKVIRITRSENDLLLLKDRNKSYYEILREKLKWG